MNFETLSVVTLNCIQSTIARNFYVQEKNLALHSHQQVMSIALVIYFWWKSKRSHLSSVTRQSYSLICHKTLHTTIDVNVNFIATFEKGEQSFIAKMKGDQVRWISTLNVLKNVFIENVVVNLKQESF